MNKMNINSTRDTIYALVEKIIAYEDQIKAFKHNSAYQTALTDLSKNKENIKILNQFIKNEHSICSQKINQIKSDIAILNSQLSSYQPPLNKYSVKDYEQSLIRQKCFEKTLYIYNSEYNVLEENMKMLKEEKLTTENDLVYLMSIKETYEETLLSYTQFMFKNLILSNELSASISSFKHFITNIEVYELSQISIYKLVNYIYDLLSQQIVSLNSNIKQKFNSIINDVYDKYKKRYISINDFIRNACVNIVNSDTKMINFVDSMRFEFVVRVIIKILYFDYSIESKLVFINNEYQRVKNKMKTQANELKMKIELIRKKMEDEQQQGNNVMKVINEGKVMGDKNEEVKMKIKVKEQEMESVVYERDKNIESYKKEIKDLNEINKVLELKYNSEKNEKDINDIKIKIDQVFMEIKNIIKDKGDCGDDILNMFINEINSTINNNNNNQEDDIISKQ